jgi:hypothetical protein
VPWFCTGTSSVPPVPSGEVVAELVHTVVAPQLYVPALLQAPSAPRHPGLGHLCAAVGGSGLLLAHIAAGAAGACPWMYVATAACCSLTPAGTSVYGPGSTADASYAWATHAVQQQQQQMLHQQQVCFVYYLFACAAPHTHPLQLLFSQTCTGAPHHHLPCQLRAARIMPPQCLMFAAWCTAHRTHRSFLFVMHWQTSSLLACCNMRAGPAPATHAASALHGAHQQPCSAVLVHHGVPAAQQQLPGLRGWAVQGQLLQQR